MRVLLVQPNQERTRGFQRMACLEPLGLEMIAGALSPRHEVGLVDLRLEPNRLAATLADFRPDVVGISANFSTDIYQAVGVAEAVRELAPEAYVIVGGHHPSLRPTDFYHAAVDAIVLGEGEVTARELADCLAAGGDPSQVPGLALNRPDGQWFTEERPLLENLDALPQPDRSLTAEHRRFYHLVLSRPVALVETARGCPYRCCFCAVWRFHRGGVRCKSAQRVVEELAQVEEPNVLFTDDNFLSDIHRSREIACLIRARGIRKHYQIQARSDAIARHPEVIAQWRDVGLGTVFIGFEKPAQAELEAVNKRNTIENNEKALAVLRRQGIEPTASFIVDPDYGQAEFTALRAYVRRLRLRWPTFTVLTPLPGTALFEEMKERLATANSELFDLLHAVVPTRLPLPEFYRELAALWRSAYPPWRQRLARLYFALRDLLSGGTRCACWRDVLAEISRLANAAAYQE
jgi:radical SAM superfamily enzyme YgiQ (UPF0313 family)